jgi:rare lipoprotein A (peptidoglycan hydrolase)
MPAYLARTGLAVFAMVFALTAVTDELASGGAMVAAASTYDLPPLHEIAAPSMQISVAVIVAGVESAPAVIAPPISGAAPALAVAAPPLQAAPPVVAATVQSDAIVLASWYGPGFYGNRTACGQLYTPEILGVAHLTLPCGTKLTLTFGSRSVSVTVIDRGPYIAGRAIDLSNATRLALGCTDLCTVRMQVLR